MPEVVKSNGAGKNKPLIAKEVVKEVVAESKKKLTAEQELRAENFKLKTRILQLQDQLNNINTKLLSIQLQQEKSQLDKELGTDWMSQK